MYRAREILTVGLLGMSALVFGCGPNGGEEGPKSVPVEDFAPKTLDIAAEASCTGIWECPRKQGAATVAYASTFGDKATCTDKIFEIAGLGAEEAASDLKSDIEKGLTEYDGKKAAECLDQLEKRADNSPCASAGSLDFGGGPCDEVTTGTQGMGEPCDDDTHCKSGYCDEDAGSADTCYGECGPKLEDVGAGKQCGPDTPKRCEPGANLVCVSESQGDQFACKKRNSVEKGGSCTQSNVCSGELSCVSQTCQKLTIKEKGESCSQSDSSQMCAPGLVCQSKGDGSSGSTVCNPPKSKGDSCISQVCKYGLYCDGVSLMGGNVTPGTCKETKENGAKCSQSVECESFNCDQGQCKKSAGQQEECTVPTDGDGG